MAQLSIRNDSSSNQAVLEKSIKHLNSGKAKQHDIIEVD